MGHSEVSRLFIFIFNVDSQLNPNDAKTKSTTGGSLTTSRSRQTSATLHHQPDLVQGVQLQDAANALEQREQEVKVLRDRLKHNAKGLEALCVAFGHLANDLRGFDAPLLSRQVDQLKSDLQAKEEELGECKIMKITRNYKFEMITNHFEQTSNL